MITPLRICASAQSAPSRASRAHKDVLSVVRPLRRSRWARSSHRSGPTERIETTLVEVRKTNIIAINRIARALRPRERVEGAVRVAEFLVETLRPLTGKPPYLEVMPAAAARCSFTADEL